MTLDTENCPFCQIIRGEIPSAKVYEDEHTLAFLDIAPFVEGHTLVIPKKHIKNMLEFDPNHATHLFKTIKHVAPAVMKATGSEGFHILQNNFMAAGQTVFHAHWHIIPRAKNDNFIFGTHITYKNNEAMREMAKAITKHL